MRLVDGASRGQRGVAIAEDDRHDHPDGPAQPLDRMCSEIRVLVDTGRDFRMRELHQQRAAAPEQQDVLAVHPACDRVIRVKARSHQPN